MKPQTAVYANVTMHDVSKLLYCTAHSPGPRVCRACRGSGGRLGLEAGPVSLGFIVNVRCETCAGLGDVCAGCGRPHPSTGTELAPCPAADAP